MKIKVFVSKSSWFSELTDKAKKIYLKEHPDSKYAKGAKSVKTEKRQSYKFKNLSEDQKTKLQKALGLKELPKQFLVGTVGADGATIFQLTGTKPIRIADIGSGALQNLMKSDYIEKAGEVEVEPDALSQ